MIDEASLLALLEAQSSFSAIRAQGAGGQNVNKVSSAVHLRFDIAASTLPEALKARLLAVRDQRITDEGVVVIKAQSHRSQDMNRAEALQRLAQLVRSAERVPRVRRATQAHLRLDAAAPGRQEPARAGQGRARQGRAGLGRRRQCRHGQGQDPVHLQRMRRQQPEVAGQVPALRRLEHAAGSARRSAVDAPFPEPERHAAGGHAERDRRRRGAAHSYRPGRARPRAGRRHRRRRRGADRRRPGHRQEHAAAAGGRQPVADT